uniref:Uncharacterized protein n=1 Tax=Anguilla anguilla TaxID=7936 RepID=A0A0E9UZV4_ANGAN
MVSALTTLIPFGIVLVSDSVEMAENYKGLSNR